eukprot:14285540-Alexandrium_andersonii.AAC.1
MSASLVGSEMCIRDSKGAEPPDEDKSCKRLARYRECANAKSDQSGTQRPVSYTHLTLPTICSV